jgi:hypothetical protein
MLTIRGRRNAEEIEAIANKIESVSRVLWACFFVAPANVIFDILNFPGMN